MAARPEPNGRLADGVLIQGRIRGWIAGMPLLRIQTSLVLAPAQIDEQHGDSGRPRNPQPPRMPDGGLAERRPPRRRAPPVPTLALAERGPSRGLAEAVRIIREGAERLDEARRTRL